MTRYAGLRAVVLGAAGDIGLAIAKRLVEGGAQVVLTAGTPRARVRAGAELGSAARVVATVTGVGEDDVDLLFADTVVGARSLLSRLRDGGAVVFTTPAATTEVEALAAELADRGIRVNAVAPACIAAAGTSTPLPPLGRLGSAEEVARVALFLATEATFTTGTSVPVDGGLTTDRSALSPSPTPAGETGA